MSEHYPNIRVRVGGGPLVFREGLSLRFSMPHPHRIIASSVMRLLERYLQITGPLLGKYADDEGEWLPLDERGWSRVREELQSERSACVHLTDVSSRERRFSFHYVGPRFDPEHDLKLWPNERSWVELWLPTEMLEERGPGHVRELALELAAFLPWSSGYVGLAFNGDLDVIPAQDPLEKLYPRYPGIDIVSGHVSLDLGDKVLGPAWLTFLGQPVLGELGGVDGLRSRLHTPGTTVQALEDDRAVVTLGLWPEAGDNEQGKDLPAYRELARVLEPWLYKHREDYRGDFASEEDRKRWDRRFLD